MPVYKNIEKKTKDGRYYYFTCNYVALDGTYKKHQSKMFATAKEAKKAEAEYKLMVGKSSATNAKTFRQLVFEYLADREKKTKPTTHKHISNCCSYITKHIGNIRIDKLTTQQFEQFRNEIDSLPFTAKFKNRILNYLKSIIRFSNERYGVTTQVPMKFENFVDIEVEQKEMEFFTLAEFQQFISVVKDIKWRALFSTLFYMGLRCGEANALNWYDVDFEKNTISITKTVTTKFQTKGKYLIQSPKTKSSIRTLPMPKKVREALLSLKEYYSAFKGFDDSWFVYGGIKAIAESTIQKNKNSYCTKAGVKNIRVHDFRHSCASLLINNGANITLVSKFLGHTDISMTLNRYSHFYKSKLDELIAQIDSLEGNS